MYYHEQESSTLELKRELPKNDQIVKTMIGFCNQNGGKLIIGVDNNRKIVGISENELNKALEYLDKAIYEATSPSIIPRIYSQRIGDKTIMILEVSSGMNKPYFRKSEGINNGTYIRLGRTTLKATQEIIEELRWKSAGLDYEKMPNYQADKNELDLKKVQGFLSDRKNHAKVKISDDILQSYYLIFSEHIKCYLTIAGILLFGKNPQKYLSEAMIICSHFKGISGRDALAFIDCESTLFDQFEQAYSFILSRLSKSFKIQGPKREEKLEIPETAIREALLNAIVHRNYHIKAPIKIAIYEDRIEIFSPGQFPGPLNVNQLTSGLTYLRNPAICKVFREANYIEKLGTGFITIFDEYEKNNLKKPQVIEGENFIKCILPRKKEEDKKLENFDELSKIMNLFDRFKEITIKDVIRELAISKATAVRKLNILINDYKIKRIGHAKSTKYIKIVD
ncbi:MAG: putative DNA binding domain-containing protein [Parachlamydiales bacterium]|nr:putative DNA binding domain-containing protein [Parachlamydiales bacterium]